VLASTGRRMALGGLLVVAAALRIHEIDGLEVWVDEANSYLTARRSLPEILRMLKLDSSPPAYYLLLHYWMGAFGDSPAALRALAASFSVALVGVVYAVGSRWLSPAVGLWAGAMIALSPTQIFFSQQVRMYSLLGLLSLLAAASLVRFLETGARRNLVACWLATVAALYTHNFAFHLLPVLAVVVLVSGQLRERWPAWLASLVVVVGAYSPWLPTLQRQLANEDHYAWFLPLWNQFGALGALWNTVLCYSPAGGYLMFDHRGEVAWGVWPAAGALLVVVFGAFSLAARRGELGALRAAWVPISLCLPMLTALGASLWMTPHYVSGRVDQMMYPAYALLFGAGAAQFRPRALQGGLAIALVAAGLVGKSFYATDYRQHDFRGAERELAGAVREMLAPGDVIVTTSLSRASLEYYLRDLDVEIVSYPRETAAHLGAQNVLRLIADPKALAREAQAVIETARTRAGPQGRLVLLRSRLNMNDVLGPEQLHRNFSIELLEKRGRFAQSGTKDWIWLSLHRLRLPGSS
jgi:hypothetical protein